MSSQFFVFIFCFIALSGQAHASPIDLNGTWELKSSTIEYKVTHLLKTMSGKTHKARGKGVCSKGGCQFIVAVPVMTFTTGDSNRDANVLETARAGSFPMVELHARFSSAPKGSTIPVHVTIKFAGKTKVYGKLAFIVETKNDRASVQGVVPLKLTDYKIKRPSLLTAKINDLVPVKFKSQWFKLK